MISDSSLERFVRLWADHVTEAGLHAQTWSDVVHDYRNQMIQEFFRMPMDNRDKH